VFSGTFALAIAIVVSAGILTAQPSSSPPTRELKLFVPGDSARLPGFVESLRREFAERGLTVKLAERGAEFDFNIVLVQESKRRRAAAMQSCLIPPVDL
jgi:hypothetical protein